MTEPMSKDREPNERDKTHYVDGESGQREWVRQRKAMSEDRERAEEDVKTACRIQGEVRERNGRGELFGDYLFDEIVAALAAVRRDEELVAAARRVVKFEVDEAADTVWLDGADNPDVRFTDEYKEALDALAAALVEVKE